MSFLGWVYGQEGHAVYPEGESPYARPESIEVIEGGVGFDPEYAVEVLNVKRLPWELPDSDLYREDWLSGGVVFPAGRYRVTMKNNIRPAQGMPDAGELEYPFVYTGWIYALERRPHQHAILAEHPFQWYPFPVYAHAYTETRSHLVNAWLGQAPNPDHWEPDYDEHGTVLAFATKGDLRIAAIIGRIVWVWRIESIPDYATWLEAVANVNGFSFRPTANDGYIMFGTDGPH